MFLYYRPPVSAGTNLNLVANLQISRRFKERSSLKRSGRTEMAGLAPDEWTHPDRAFLLDEKAPVMKGSRCVMPRRARAEQARGAAGTASLLLVLRTYLTARRAQVGVQARVAL